ncbi:hypothetical protein Tco_1075778, partial [Tanacetum coccineum]
LERNLAGCAKDLTSWSRKHLRNNRKVIQELTNELRIVQSATPTADNNARQRLLQEKLEETWRKEEMFWHQRSKVNWIKFSDQNTRFFHLSTIHRSQRNAITMLKNEEGEWVDDVVALNTLIKNHFTSIYTSVGAMEFGDVLDVIQPIVTEHMNTTLVDTIADCEIVRAVKQFGAYKAPGKDGFPGKNIQLYSPRFFWHGDAHGKHIHWLSWDCLSKPKDEEGIGFRDLHSFNLALLAKQGSHPSWLWQSLLLIGRDVFFKVYYDGDVLLQGIRWQVGNGEKISFWTHKWVPYNSDFFIREPRGPFTNTSLVSDFIVVGEWDYCKLQQHLFPREVDFVSQIPISNTGAQDKLVWHYDDKGNYSVRSGYRQALLLKEKDLNHASSSSSPTGCFDEIVLLHQFSPYVEQLQKPLNICCLNANGQNPSGLDPLVLTSCPHLPLWRGLYGSLTQEMLASGIGRPVNSVRVIRYLSFGKKWRCDSALAAELQAIRIACVFALNKGWFNAIIESDSQTTIMLATTENVPP